MARGGVTRGLARRRAAWIVLLGSLGVWATTGAVAQPNVAAQDAEDAVKHLVVRIDADLQLGAGIIVSTGPDAVHIATANHVVRKGSQDARRIEVRFRAHPDQPVPATLLPHRDEALDLAVLRVTAAGDLALAAAGLSFDRLGDPRSLQRGDPLFLLGHPNGLPWRVNTVAERFIEHRQDFVDFESNLIARGHSGGALLDDGRAIIGMLKSDQAPYGEALSMTTIVAKLKVWGYPVGLHAPLRLSLGAGRTCVVTPDGTARCWGHDARIETGPPAMRGVRLKSVSAGAGHVCGIAATTGAAMCVGGNAHGQLGDGTTLSKSRGPSAVQGGLSFASVSAGYGHTCGIVPSGDAYCWGLGELGQLGRPSDKNNPLPVRVPAAQKFKAVSASIYYSCALAVAGGAYCWGAVAGAQGMASAVTPAPAAPGLTFRSLATGYHHICGITTAGAAVCWGFNDDGQLGNGATSKEYTDVPTPVAGKLVFRSLSAGVAHSCGVTPDGTAYCWGLNNMGQLGDGTKTKRNAPVRVSGGVSFESISAGALHTCGATLDHAVFCWGRNENGEVGPSGQSEHTVPWRVPGSPVRRP
jgi:alpha-tubulin suppressor-like RCC1 family protein